MWERPAKYKFFIHAEANAILDAKQDLRGAILYSTLQPCCECIKLIAGAGIDRVYFKNEYHGHAAESYQLAKEFGLTFEQLSFVGFAK
jgi:dCMP deaminase